MDGSSVLDDTVIVEKSIQSNWYNEDTEKASTADLYDKAGVDYVLNTRRKKIHRPEYNSV